MSKLLKAQRVLSHCEAWVAILSGAFMITGVEPTDKRMMQVTYQLIDKITIDETNNQLLSTTITDDDVIAIVEKLE